jgi:hypothetical protein
MGEKKLRGHCYCGAVKFEIVGESDWVGHCHCESCRRQSGSVMTTFAGFRIEQVKFSGAKPAPFLRPVRLADILRIHGAPGRNSHATGTIRRPRAAGTA